MLSAARPTVWTNAGPLQALSIYIYIHIHVEMEKAIKNSAYDAHIISKGTGNSSYKSCQINHMFYMYIAMLMGTVTRMKLEGCHVHIIVWKNHQTLQDANPPSGSKTFVAPSVSWSPSRMLWKLPSRKDPGRILRLGWLCWRPGGLRNGSNWCVCLWLSVCQYVLNLFWDGFWKKGPGLLFWINFYQLDPPKVV